MRGRGVLRILGAVMREWIKKLAALISESERMVAFTGAGISAESGIPTYRGEGGVWDKYDPNLYADIDVFLRDPSYYWTFFKEVRLGLLSDIQPSAGHLALARLEKAGRLSSVVTQNIDGLHQDAGSERVIELHGNTRKIFCMRCGITCAFEVLCDILERQNPPLCASCGGVLRPDVVFFGEQLPVEAMLGAMDEARQCDLMLVIGSTLAVYPAAGMPAAALEGGARLAILNKGETAMDEAADLKIDGSAGEVMTAVLEEVGL